MVKIAIAGGTSGVAKEIIHALVEAGKHEIRVLSRAVLPEEPIYETTLNFVLDYTEHEQLDAALNGVDVVLCFITTMTDNNNQAQKNLIDAAVRSKVRRFAPSEWVSSTLEHLPFYAGKAEIRQYLRQINHQHKVLEYCLFQPGLFTDYLTFPNYSAKHFRAFPNPFDLEHRRVLVRKDGLDDHLTFTTVTDLAQVVVKAIDYDGEWPEVGGIRGAEMSIREILATAEAVRGSTFAVEEVRLEDLEAGDITTSWFPRADGRDFSSKEADQMACYFVRGLLQGIAAGSFSVSDEWNKILPDFLFTSPRDCFLRTWSCKGAA